jgi:TolB-like protein/tetratricopeptide (TPR) repeat protein
MPTAASANEPSVFRFGVFEFHTEKLDLTRQGTPLRLQMQPARLLRLLLARAGELVTRDEIQKSLWQEGTTVDFDMAVNRCIRQLREVLGDDSDAPRYIRTIPRLGYCFIAAIGTNPATVLEKPVTSEISTVQPTETQPSIAVLPFANLSSDPHDEYLSDGLAEEITNVLAQIPGLKVIARTSAFKFKGKNEDIRLIAQALDVGNVLEGSVRRNGPRVRVTVQLIRAADGSHCLSKRYDRELTDVFALEDEISGDVAQELRFHLGVAKRPTGNVLAYQAYLEGLFHWGHFSLSAFKKGLQCFERALTIDPGYAAAHTGVARCLLGLMKEGGESALEYLPRAAATARRALELNEFEGEAHCVLGEVAVMLDYDWTRAAEHFQTALQLNPSTYVRASYALWYLIPHGRAAEALAQSEAVLERDPLNVVGYLLRATVLFFVGNNEASAEACLRVLTLNESSPRAMLFLSLIHSYQGQFEEGVRWAERLIQIFGRIHMSLFALGVALAEAGRLEAARLVLAELENLPFARERFPASIALVYSALGDQENALFWLQRAVEFRDPTILRIRMLRKANCLQSNILPEEILRKMNLA